MNSRWKWVLVLSVIVAAMPACSKKEEARPATKTAPHVGAEQKVQQEMKQASEETTAATDMGRAVYEKNCAVCHERGIAGAPRVGDKAAWSEHIAHGTGHMVQNAVHGIGAMPPKGGNSALSEEEIRAAVHYMVEQSR